MTRREEMTLLGLAAGGLATVGVGSHVHSLLLMSAGFLMLASYCFLYLAWTHEP